MVVINTSVVTECNVIVWRENGDVSIIGTTESTVASDVFDYYEQALGYFRFAIETMDARKIEIEVRIDGRLIQQVEISKD